MNKPENKPETTIEKTPEKTPENLGKTPDNNTQQLDNQGVDFMMEVLKVPVRVKEGHNVDAPSNPFAKKGISMTDNISEKTEGAGDILEAMIDEDDDPNKVIEFEEADLVSETLIEGLDTVLSFGGQLAVMEFNDDKDERYSLPQKRKDRLRKPLTKLMMKRGKMISPEVAFSILAFIYILPVIVKIIGDIIEKKKARKREIERRAELNLDGNLKVVKKGGRPRTCKICDMPETNKKEPKKICVCDRPDFSGKAKK